MKKKNNIRVVITTQSIGMEKKKEVVLIKNNIDKISEDDIKKLVKSIEKENHEIKDMYYSINTPVVNARQRTFKELVEKFFHSISDIGSLYTTVGTGTRNGG